MSSEGAGRGATAAVTGFTSLARLLAVALGGDRPIARIQAQVTARELELLSGPDRGRPAAPRIERRSRFAELPAAIA